MSVVPKEPSWLNENKRQMNVCVCTLNTSGATLATQQEQEKVGVWSSCPPTLLTREEMNISTQVLSLFAKSPNPDTQRSAMTLATPCSLSRESRAVAHEHLHFSKEKKYKFHFSDWLFAESPKWGSHTTVQIRPIDPAGAGKGGSLKQLSTNTCTSHKEKKWKYPLNFLQKSKPRHLTISKDTGNTAGAGKGGSLKQLSTNTCTLISQQKEY